MRKAFLFLILGLVSYAAYQISQDPAKFRERLSGLLDTAPKQKQAADSTAKDAKGQVSNSVSNALREMTEFVNENAEKILSPLTAGEEPALVIALAPLKARLSTEAAKTSVAAEKARLQAAMQLAGLMEQAIAQRAEHVKRRRAAKYHEPPETRSRSRVSPSEINAKMKQAEFFVAGVDKKWNDLAAQYRAAFSRLLVSMSA
jgi:O-succinylbenzoate synthase